MLLIQILSYHLCLKLQTIYEVNSVTIIADKGMSVNRNIRFLESKNWKYIISYRMKAGSKQFKEYVLAWKRLCKYVVWYTKLVILHLHTIKKELMDILEDK